jgi:hypothetical protein
MSKKRKKKKPEKKDYELTEDIIEDKDEEECEEEVIHLKSELVTKPLDPDKLKMDPPSTTASQKDVSEIIDEHVIGEFNE